MRHWLIISLSTLLLCGCASVSPDAAFDRVKDLAANRIPQRIHWRTGLSEDAEVSAQVDKFLSAPLELGSAVQIALLENAALQERYEELGISQANLVQEGLLRNPVFFASGRISGRSSSLANIEFSVAEDFLNILTRSARVHIAEANLELAEFQVADAIMILASEVGVAYFEALGAKQVVSMRKLTAEAAQAGAELASRLHAAGNISDRALALELDMYESTRVSWAKAEVELASARERLTRKMGLWGPRANWDLPDQLPPLPDTDLSRGELESLAMQRRYDLAAARREADIAAAALGLTRDWRYLAVLDFGASRERDTSGEVVTGPSLSIELPLFDQRQAEIAAMEASLRQRDRRVEAMAIDIRSEVRELQRRLLSMRTLLEHLRDVVVPLREEIVQLSQEEFNFMLVGAFEVIQAKRDEYDAYQGYLETLTDYWTTRARLERATGGALSGRAAGHAAGMAGHVEDGGDVR